MSFDIDTADNQRPDTLWKYREPTQSVEAYFDAHRGEFRLRGMKSLYPYQGNAWKNFRELPEINPYEGYHRFAGRGEGCWELIRDNIRNNRTADLLAAADLLTGKGESAGITGPPRGFGVDQRGIWVGLLDGGVGVEVHVDQDEETNRPDGWQRTTIRGPRAFRCLLELLGFDWINEKLTGEESSPTRGDIMEEVNRLLTRRKA